jgi:hypothetical protein
MWVVKYRLTNEDDKEPKYLSKGREEDCSSYEDSHNSPYKVSSKHNRSKHLVLSLSFVAIGLIIWHSNSALYPRMRFHTQTLHQ